MKDLLCKDFYHANRLVDALEDAIRRAIPGAKETHQTDEIQDVVRHLENKVWSAFRVVENEYELTEEPQPPL